MSLANVFAPVAGELGLGGVSGFCVGYAVKKVSKLVASILAVFFLRVQYLAYIGVVKVNQAALQVLIEGIMAEAGALQGAITTYIIQLSFGAGFAGGLILGLKQG